MIMWPSYRFGWGGDPVMDLDRLHDEVNRLFSGYRDGNRFASVNVWTNDDSVRILAEIPGVDPKAVNVQIEGNAVEISGERIAPELGDGEQYVQQNMSYGPFRRIVELPYEVQVDQVKAKYRNGVLEVDMPRSEATKPKRIDVQVS